MTEDIITEARRWVEEETRDRPFAAEENRLAFMRAALGLRPGTRLAVVTTTCPLDRPGGMLTVLTSEPDLRLAVLMLRRSADFLEKTGRDPHG